MTDVLSNLTKHFEESINHFKVELQRLRAGRASSGMLEGVFADYYGSQVPLIQLGMINVPEPRMITIQVYDAGAVENVEKAIRQANLGLNPSRDGNLIRISVPALTEERRKELIKKLSQTAEESKVALRNARREAIEEIKANEKDKGLSQDESRKQQEKVQKLIDEYTAKIDKLREGKEKEMLEV